MRLPGALLDTRPLSESPAFRRLWLGTTASRLGGQLSTVALTFHVWDRTRSPALVGLIGLFVAGPLIAFALLGSAFADHVDRTRLVTLCTCGQAVSSALMAVVAAVAGDRVWALLVLAGVGSGLSALTDPARRAFIPRLLPADRLAAGLALHHLSVQLAMLAGPAMAGVLTARYGTSACFAVDAVTFIAALAGTAGLPQTGSADGGGPPGAGAVWSGIRLAVGTPATRGALLADLTATVLAMPVALFPVINADRFGGSPETLGLLYTAVAAGGVLASTLSGLISRRGRPGLVLLGCAAMWGASLAGVGAGNRLPIVLGLLAMAGAADTWSVVSRGAVVQLGTPESHRGRVASLEHVVGVAGPQLGNLRAGLVAAGTSAGAAFLIGGLGCLAGIALIAAAIPELRRLTADGMTPRSPRIP